MADSPWPALTSPCHRSVDPERSAILGRGREPGYFGIANRAGADSYFSMNRLVSATSLAIATLLVLTGCATDDDPFPVHPAATTTDSEVPVAGAASPRKGKLERRVEVVVAYSRELSALITFDSISFIGSARFWPERFSPLSYPSLSRHLYFEPACHLCPKHALVSSSWITDYGFDSCFSCVPLSSHSRGNVAPSIHFIDGACRQP